MKDLESLKEWLASWGDGPNWTDASGATVPIVKQTLRDLIADAERMRDALRDLKTRALDARDISPAWRASFAIICEDAIEGPK
jgi:hypothetical protein